MFDNDLKKILFFILFWMVFPFFNVLTISIFLPHRTGVLGMFINLGLWPLIAQSVMWVTGLVSDVKEIAGRGIRERKSILVQSSLIALGYSFVATLVVSLFTKNTFGRCFWVYIVYAILWAVLLNFLYKKNIFSPEDFDE